MYYIKLKIQTIKFKCIFSNYVRNKNTDFKIPNQVIIFLYASLLQHEISMNTPTPKICKDSARDGNISWPENLL